ncbi:MAG TPA: PilN domain-containing protein [Fibrobacteria bacterium]|nr:PilN domain-containing protein [Fibrobacteria bacterium]
MIAKSGMSLYRLNLIRDLREREIKSERQHRLAVILGAGCFGFFLLSLLYSGLTIMQMERVLTNEKDKVQRLQREYRKYTSAKLIVDKSDIELLNDLQARGVFWTKKLASMAKHLPDNYWITSFSFNNNVMNVKGYGFANSQQDQLLVLDQYLNRLRKDTTFSDTFSKIQLNSAERKDESGRVSFDFSAFTSKWKPL